MSFADHINSMLGICQNVFGTPVTFEDKDSNVYSLHGIYSDLYAGIDPDSGYEVISSQPNLGIKLKDWPKTPQESEKIIISGNNYTVRHTEPDGEGGAVVILNKDIE